MNLDDLKLQWQALEGWKKVAVITIFTGAIIYLIYMFKLEPLMVEKEKLDQDVQQLKNEISFLKKHAVPQKIIEIQKKIEQINNEIKSKQLELENLKTIIPDKAEIDKILNFVTYNVSASNLILNKFNVSKEDTVYVSYNQNTKSLEIRTPGNNRNSRNSSQRKNEIKLKRLTVNVNLTGTPSDLLKYISKLENSKRLLIIDDVSLKTEKEGVNINMNISTFYSEVNKQ